MDIIKWLMLFTYLITTTTKNLKKNIKIMWRKKNIERKKVNKKPTHKSLEYI